MKRERETEIIERCDLRSELARANAPFLSGLSSTVVAKGNTLYMPTTFPKCSVQFFAATGACDESDSEASRQTQGRNTHVLLRARVRVAYTCVCNWLVEEEERLKGGKREKGSARFIRSNFDGRSMRRGGRRFRGMYFVFGISRAEHIVYPTTTERGKEALLRACSCLRSLF